MNIRDKVLTRYEVVVALVGISADDDPCMKVITLKVQSGDKFDL